MIVLIEWLLGNPYVQSQPVVNPPNAYVSIALDRLIIARGGSGRVRERSERE